jgi:hypothetical protein
VANTNANLYESYIMTLSYTKNLHLAVPDFLTEPWHSEFAQAMDSIDQIVFSAIVAANTALWVNDHHYEIGDLVISPDTGGIFSAAVEHDSSLAPQTFTQELSTFPTYWTAFAPVLASQAEAEAGVDNTKFMSPLRVAQAIDVQSAQAGVASQPEAEAGVDNTQMMTPLRTAQAVAVRIRNPPQGRLTLISDQAVMTTPMVSTPIIYYTPYLGTTVPIWNGIGFDIVDFWDQLPASIANTTHNPSPVGPVAVVDWFVWVSAATATITIGTPAVVSYAGHGFLQDQPIQFTTTGTLPAGMTPNTTYYVMATGLTANTFQITASRQTPVAINATGAQTGTHTLHSRRLTHGVDWTNDGVRAGPTTLFKIKGIWANAATITNGPPQGLGTYVGSTRSTGGGLLSWVPFSATVFADPCLLLVYNAYNRVPVVAGRQDPTGFWLYSAGVERDSNANPANRIWVLDGLGDSFSRITYGVLLAHDASGVGNISIQVLCNSAPVGGILRVAQTGSGFAGYDTLIASFDTFPTLGAYFAQAREYAAGSSVTFHGSAYYSISMGIQM